jgi:hypothetical protein
MKGRRREEECGEWCRAEVSSSEIGEKRKGEKREGEKEVKAERQNE